MLGYVCDIVLQCTELSLCCIAVYSTVLSLYCSVLYQVMDMTGEIRCSLLDNSVRTVHGC